MNLEIVRLLGEQRTHHHHDLLGLQLVPLLLGIIRLLKRKVIAGMT